MKSSLTYIIILIVVSVSHINLQNELMAQTSEHSDRLISVSGEGIAKTIPDMATVRFGIVTRHENPEEARRLNAETAREAMRAIRQIGVEESKLSLQTLRLQPVREYDPQTRKQVDKGYEAARDLVVVVEDLEQLPTLIAEIVQKGANRLNGITYGLKNQDAAKNKALVEAVQKARKKAELMASTLGVRVGKALQVQEQSNGSPQPVMMRESGPQLMMAKSGAAPEPEAYAAGEIEVKAAVRIVFQLEE